ncbi:adipokinetic hormone/corazonin-related peptide receptor variant I-like [Argiope bruennichi]|uniref:adipokinetic hormone/corazonin-related peptide receptor variant I-like n=1 Tax=Argiope bruennichi TaxID=94029 RepID=UPI00249520A8|nr:adipokinetic hormone/corazonin-related peptide receptor variant I-like [Argiope bruennichi]
MSGFKEINITSSTSQYESVVNATNNSRTIEDLLEFTEESRVEAIIYTFLFLFATCGNVPVFISLIRGRRRRSRIEEMIMHLTIADLIVTCVMIPLEICWRITVEWVAGDFLCRIMMFFRAFGPYLSSKVLVCISIDRFTAIVYPLKVNVAQERVRFMLRCAWASSFLCSIPQAFIFHVESHPVQTDFEQCVSFHSFKNEFEKISYNLFCLFVFYCGPLSVIVYCYCRVLWVIWKRSKLAKDSIEDNRSETSSHCIFRLSDTRHLEKTRSRTLKMTFLIVISFFFCWTPYVIIDLWYLFDSESAEKLDTRIQSSMFMFAVFNSCINPLVYGSYIFNFKDSLKNLFRCRRLQLRSGQSNSQIPRRVTSEDRLGRGTDEYRSSQPGEVILELREATPVRRPLSRRNLMNVHRTEENLVLNSCDNSQFLKPRRLPGCSSTVTPHVGTISCRLLQSHSEGTLRMMDLTSNTACGPPVVFVPVMRLLSN